MKSKYNDEEIVDDDDEDGQMPQVPKTLEKKIPLMNKYFNDRTRTQSDSATSTYQSFQSLLTQKSIKEKEKKKQQQKQETISEQQIQQKKYQQNQSSEEGNTSENKEQSKRLKQEESKKCIQELNKSLEEVKAQIPELDPLQYPNSTPQKDIIASNNIFSSSNYHPIFDSPIDTDQSFSKQAIQTPTKLINQRLDSQVELQSSIAKQRITTESTSSSISSYFVTIFQMPTHSINGNTQYGSNINSLSNTSFNSTNDHNASNVSTKPSVNKNINKNFFFKQLLNQQSKDNSMNDSFTIQEIEEIAIRIKRLPIKERKQKELAIIKEWNQEKNQSQHIVDISWAVQYTKWFQESTNYPFTFQISNMNLVDTATRKLKSGLKERIHYDILTSKVYFLIKCLYGGGPDIPYTKQRSLNEVIQNNNHSKSSSYGGNEVYLAKQTSSASTAATTNPSLLEYNNRSQSKAPSQFMENQIVNQQTVVVHPSQMYRKVQLPVKGLHNQSNYCYLNASIQCFLSIPELNGYFLNEEYKRIVQYQNTRKQLRLVQVYADMVKHYEKTPDRNVLDMNQLKKAIRKPFIHHEQHDAQELIRYILSELQDELNPVLPQKNPTEFDDPEIAYKYYLKYQNSIIDMVFSGQLSSCVYCSKCGHVSKTFDPFLDLSLGMDSKTSTVQDCLNKFFSEETLSDDYKCEKCKQKNKAKKQVFISKTPYMLTLHLKRFKVYPKKKKITDFVKYPLQNLSIKQYLKGGSGCGGYYYNLTGVIVHSGSQDSGHYVSYVKRDNRWFCCDDNRFQEESEKTVLKQEAYLLFYQRVEESSDTSQVKRVQQ